MNTKLYTETELNMLRSMPKRITNPRGSSTPHDADVTGEPVEKAIWLDREKRKEQL